VNDILRERLQRILEALPDDKAYQVLDYAEFLESKYATRPAGAPAFQKVAEALEGHDARAGRCRFDHFPHDGRGRQGGVAARAGGGWEGSRTRGQAETSRSPPVEEPPSR
jgi:hypothetical protein